MTKRIIGLCLLFAMIVSTAFSAFAVDVSDLSTADTTVTFETEAAEITQLVLQAIEPEKELYNGLEDVDFSELYLGEEIPAYNLTGSGPVEVTNISYFPIMYDDEWVATSKIFYNTAGKMIAQVSTAYAVAYAQEENPGTQVALIFDDQSAYLYTNSGLIEAAVNSYSTPERVSVEEYEGVLAAPVTTSLQAQSTLSVSVTSAAQSRNLNPRSFETQEFLMVPKIKQTAGTAQCWAACIASIRSYYGTATTINNVYDFSGATKYVAKNIHFAKAVLEDYGFSVTPYLLNGLNFYQLRIEIAINGNPVYGACTIDENTNQGHAIVLRGFMCYTNVTSVLGTISYMDPQTGDYAASYVQTDGKLDYVPEGTSLSYEIIAGLGVSD